MARSHDAECDRTCPVNAKVCRCIACEAYLAACHLERHLSACPGLIQVDEGSDSFRLFIEQTCGDEVCSDEALGVLRLLALESRRAARRFALVVLRRANRLFQEQS